MKQVGRAGRRDWTWVTNQGTLTAGRAPQRCGVTIPMRTMKKLTGLNENRAPSVCAGSPQSQEGLY